MPFKQQIPRGNINLLKDSIINKTILRTTKLLEIGRLNVVYNDKRSPVLRNAEIMYISFKIADGGYFKAVDIRRVQLFILASHDIQR